MKKHLLTIIAATLILCSCNKTNQFKVNLNLENADNYTVYLAKTIDGTQSVGVDTAVITGTTATLKADFDDEQAVYVIKFKELRDYLILFPDNQDVTVTGDVDEFYRINATGSETQNTYNDFNQSLLQFIEPFIALQEEMEIAYMTNDSVTYMDIYAQLEDIMDDYHAYQVDYIKNQPDSYMTHYLLDEMKTDLEFDEVKELAEGFTTESVFSKNVNEFIEKSQRVNIGQPFIDFTLQTADGDDINLAETIKNNKVTLVDFWASWCGPCRNENPFVKAAYEKYHAKGLEIIGVSVDQNEAKWLQAVEDDDLPYIQVLDVDGSVSDDYSVIYIPSNFLYDQNGIMIGKGLRGEELEAKLAEILGN